MRRFLSLFTLSVLICACTAAPVTNSVEDVFIDLSKRDKPEAITQNPWNEVVINVELFEDIAPLFTEIGGFETIDKTKNHWILGARGAEGSFVRLVEIGEADPARPATSRSWDKGCYFSVMMRAKDLPSIIEDAAPLGWTPLTEMAYLEFGQSKLNIIVLTHKTGVRVQLYERLNRPIPEGFTPFERLSRPFNIMQMVEDRDASYDFFQQGLGFDTFFYGKPYRSEIEEVMPLGIPPKLTTTIPYKTAIVAPKAGLEYGRMEMIDIEDMEGSIDYAPRCNHDHTGIVEIRFDVPDLDKTRQDLVGRGLEFQPVKAKTGADFIRLKSPDGSNIAFHQAPKL